MISSFLENGFANQITCEKTFLVLEWYTLLGIQGYSIAMVVILEPEKIDANERQKALLLTQASSRIEGLQSEEFATDLLKKKALGELTTEQVKMALDARYKR